MSRELVQKGKGRPRSFKREDLLRSAVDMFWQDGFDGVSLNEIARSNGLTRSSVFSAFGSKDEIYLEGLALYVSEHPISKLMKLDSKADATQAIFEVFADFTAFLSTEANRRGCFVANETTRLVDREGATFDRFRAMFAEIDSAIARSVAQSRRQGGLQSDARNLDICRVVSAYITGLSTLSKSGLNKRELDRTSRILLESLGFSDGSRNRRTHQRS